MARRKDGPTLQELYKSMGLSDSQVSTKGNVKADTSWKSEMLKPLPSKQYGSSYDKKLNSVFGGDQWAAKDFERWMNYRDINKTIQSHAANTAYNNWESSFKANQQKQEDERLKRFKDEQKKLDESLKKKLAEKKHPLLTDLKNFFTSKDTNGDGQRDGLLGAIDRFVLPISVGATEFLAPGNNERMIQNDIEKHGEITNPVNKASLVDRGTETKVLHGAGSLMAALAPYGEAYKGADLAFNKLPKLAKFAANNPYKTLAIKGGLAGGTAETGIAATNELFNSDANNMKDYGKRIAWGVGGGAIGDPLLRAAGVGVRKGMDSATNKAMQGLVPDTKEAAQKLSTILKDYKQEQAPLPGRPDPRLMNDLIPKGSEVTKPNFLPNIQPKQLPQVTVPRVGRPLNEILTDVLPSPNGPKLAPQKAAADTSQLDQQIEEVSRQLEQVKNQPKTRTKTQIDDELRALEINDAYLSSSRTKGKITNEEYRQKIMENEQKREALVRESKAYSNELPQELKPTWNNETRSYELGDYAAKQAYGGGFAVKKAGENVGKFRTQEEAQRFMQESVAKEKGIEVNFDKEGVLTWKSTHNGDTWDITAGDYSIQKRGNKWDVVHQDKVIGSYGNEKKAREEAQRHFDKRPVQNEQTTSLENLLNTLKQKRVEAVSTANSQTKPMADLFEQLKVMGSGGKATKPVTDPFADIQNKLKPRTKVSNETPRLTETVPDGLRERGHIKTLRDSPNTTESLKQRLKGSYKPTTNEEAVVIANKHLSQGVEKAISFVKSAKELKPEHIATAHRLIQEFQKAGQVERAVDIAEYIAEQGTKAGQTVQAYSIFNKLSPEGILVHAKRVVDKANQKLNVFQDKIVLTNETATQLTDLASTVQKMTEQKEVTNNVINLMDKAKTGAKLTDEETKVIRQFVDDAKQWLGDITPKKTKPKAPKKIISPVVKEHVVSFLDSQEEAARRRLEARKGRANSLPAEDFYDYAVIGASKLAKGSLKFADFTEQMVKEFGEELRPYAQQIYDKASEMINNEVQRTVNRLSEVQKITNKALKNGKLEESEAENLRKFALSINSMSGDAKIEASQELQAILQGLERPSFLQQVSATQTIGQLLNPKTLGRNAIGNEMFYRLERINKYVATPIDIARSKLTGKERTITFRTNNQAQYWKNWIKGWDAGLKGVNPEGLSTQYDLRPNSFNSKWNPLRYLERTLGASLKSFDYAGYKRGVNNTIGELATLRAVNEGLKGQARKQAIEKYIREADENILSLADEYGKYITFQDNNMIAVGLQKFKRGLNFGKDFGIGDLVIKYPKTPGALLARALEYSPAGFLKSAYLIAKPIYKNPSSTREITESLTRALIGTGGTFGIGWFLADAGILTGSGSKDFDIRELEKSVGKADYSLNVDALKRWVRSGFDKKKAETKEGDHFISYNWAQPIAMSMAMGVNSKLNKSTSGRPSWGGAAWEAVNGAADSMVGMSVLQGVQKAFSSYPGQSTGDKLMEIAGQLPSSFVPTLSNQIRQKLDNTYRSVYDPLKPNQFKNQAKNKVPFLEKTLPPSYDTLGNKKEVFQNKSNSLFNVFLNPSFVTKYKPTSEAKMVLDVIGDTGDTSVAPRVAQKYFRMDGKTYYLNPKQYAEYQQKLGTEVRKQLQDLYKDKGSYTNQELADEIYNILGDAGKAVRDELKEKFFGADS